MISLLLGFGVCCILILSDGGTTSLNNSYLVQASSTALGVGSREYTGCPCSSDICRIKFDFMVSYTYRNMNVAYLISATQIPKKYLFLHNVIKLVFCFMFHERCLICMHHILLLLALHHLRHLLVRWNEYISWSIRWFSTWQ